MTKDEKIAELRARYAMPSLEELIEKYGGYDKITPEAWAEFDAEKARKKAAIDRGDLYYELRQLDLPGENT